MNKKITLLFVAMLCMSFTLMAQRKSVAILETYCADGKLSSAYLMMIGSNIETGIIKNPGYTAYNRAQLKAILNEHSFQRSGMVPDDQIRELGRVAGVDYVLASEAALLDQQVFVTAKVLNVETGQYEMSDNELMDYNPSAIQRGCQNLAAKLLGGGSTPQEVHAQSTNPVSNSDYQATNISGRNVGLPQPNKDVAVKAGLVAYWTFDNGNADDATDNGYDGNLVGSPKFINETPNGYGKAILLQASRDQCLMIPHNIIGKSNGHWTLCFWIKDFGAGLIFAGGDGPSPIKFGCSAKGYLNLFEAGYATVADGYNFSCDARTLQASGWHHITYSFGNGIHYLYVDGRMVDKIQFYDGSNPKVVFGGHVEGFLGGSYNSSSFKLDNVRFYSRELTISEIKQIYNSEK